MIFEEPERPYKVHLRNVQTGTRGTLHLAIVWCPCHKVWWKFGGSKRSEAALRCVQDIMSGRGCNPNPPTEDAP